ncbi:hypothetical protein ACFL06_01380 [Patescibacteria group bacterium]
MGKVTILFLLATATGVYVIIDSAIQEVMGWAIYFGFLSLLCLRCAVFSYKQYRIGKNKL